MTSLLLALALLAQVAVPAQVPNPMPAPTVVGTIDDADGFQVRKLLRQLDAPELTARTSAEEELLKLGPSILPLLPPVEIGSAELQQRVARICQTLQKVAAVQSAQASTVTLKGTMPLLDALAAIEKQTGNKLVDHREQFGQQVSNPQVTTDFDKLSFWQALDRLLDQAQMTTYHYNGNGSLNLVSKPNNQLPRAKRGSYSGPMRVVVVSLTAERHPPLMENGTLRVGVEVAWEPRLSPITFQQSLADVTAIDEDEKPLMLLDADGELEAPLQGEGTATDISIPFIAPPRTTTKIASLKGKLQALLPGQVETFTFDKLIDATKADFKPLPQKKAAATVTLDKVRKNGDVWEVRMRIKFDDAAHALESHRGWIYQNEAYVVGPDQKRIDHAGFESTLRTEDEVGVAYLFELPGDGAGCSFVYRSPSSLHTIEVPYELKDLPLP